MSKLPTSVKASLAALILINLSSILGIVFLNWNSTFILLSYWLESLVIGIYTIFKMSKAKNIGTVEATINNKPVTPKKFPIIVFFIFHYGIFMIVHLIFLLLITSLTAPASQTNNLLWLPVFFVGLLISHGISYKQNFINNKEYKNTTVTDAMNSPYSRIIPMHLTIMLGFFLRSPAILLVILKTAVDVYSHLKERQKLGTAKNLKLSMNIG